jgi:hypothetical protein
MEWQKSLPINLLFCCTHPSIKPMILILTGHRFYQNCKHNFWNEQSKQETVFRIQIETRNCISIAKFIARFVSIFIGLFCCKKNII